MPLGINLLPRRKKPVKRWPAGKLKGGTIIILVLYVLFIAGLFGFSLLTNQQLSQVRAQKAILEAKIKEESKKESLVILLKDRLSKEGKIIKGRVDYQGIFQVIDNLSAPEVLLAELEIVKGGLSLSGEATSLAGLRSFLDGVNASADDFSFAKITSCTRTKTGGYSFLLESILSF